MTAKHTAGNWIQFGIGAFVIIAPWIFGFADLPLARWTDVLAGLIFVLVNLWVIFGEGVMAPAVQEHGAALAAVKSEIVVIKEEPLGTPAAAAARPKRSRRAAAPAAVSLRSGISPRLRTAPSTMRPRRTKAEKVLVNS